MLGLISFSKAKRDQFVILLVFAQYVSLGYISFLKLIIESILIIFVWSDLLFNIKAVHKKYSLIFAILFILLYGIFILSGDFSSMSLVLVKNFLIFLGVWSYFYKSSNLTISTIENTSISMVLGCILLGSIYPGLVTDFSSISWSKYYVNIFSPASLGLNVHFTTQLILSYFLLHLIAKIRHNKFSASRLFGIPSPLIVTVIYSFTFVKLALSTGSSTGVISFLLALLSFLFINNRLFLRSKLLNSKLFVFLLVFLLIYFLLPILLSSEQFIGYFENLFANHGLSGHGSFLIIRQQYDFFKILVQDAPALPTFQSLLNQNDPTGFLAINEVGFIFILYSYGKILTFLLLSLILFSLSPVGILFASCLLHYSYFMTGIGALVIARSQNIVMATQATAKNR